MSEETDQLITRLAAAFEKGALIKCTLSQPVPAVVADLKNIFIRPVEIKKGRRLAFNYRYPTRDEVKNYTAEEARGLLAGLLRDGFRQADLFTTEADWSLHTDAAGRRRLQQKTPMHTAPPDTAHNRIKTHRLEPSAPWLHALGITNARGEVPAPSQDKWRQIDKYLEIIESLLREQPLPSDAHVADMGSGKGYLTFALYDFMTKRLQMTPRITGIELRPQLVALCNQIARDNGFSGLQFIAQDIKDYHPERLDMLIALHACDTATDLALAVGIRRHAEIIVAAPCCHKQIRRDMQTCNELAPVLRHGILEERQAEILTDGIRALLLESEGYDTKVFEFISSEHTAKNVMITALNKHRRNREGALAKIAALKAGFGIERHYLETLLQ
ncbi:MAG: class I SAM-dependent methyltransferase [Saprospiraceae bacterium]